MFSHHAAPRLFALVATVLLALDCSIAKAAAPDLCIAGTSSGTWILPPSFGQLGHAAGTLMIDDSTTAYALFDAFLTEEPRRTPGIRSGQVIGFLSYPNEPDNNYALVVGSWEYPGGISGSFSATIYDLSGFGTFDGFMEGDFNFPIDGGTGNFQATWVVCTYP